MIGDPLLPGVAWLYPDQIAWAIATILYRDGNDATRSLAQDLADTGAFGSNAAGLSADLAATLVIASTILLGNPAPVCQSFHIGVKREERKIDHRDRDCNKCIYHHVYITEPCAHLSRDRAKWYDLRGKVERYRDLYNAIKKHNEALEKCDTR